MGHRDTLVTPWDTLGGASARLLGLDDPTAPKLVRLRSKTMKFRSERPKTYLTTVSVGRPWESAHILMAACRTAGSLVVTGKIAGEGVHSMCHVTEPAFAETASAHDEAITAPRTTS